MKKILTIAPYTIGDTNSLGITMQKFFHNCDKNRIFQIFLKEANPNRDHYKNEYIYDYVWYLHKNRVRGAADVADFDTSAASANYSFTYRLKTSVKDMIPVLLPVDLKNKLDVFRPEIVYVQLYGVQMAKLALQIERRYDIPLVVHILDDWIESDKVHRLFSGRFENSIKKIVSKLLQESKQVFGASPSMCGYIRQKFGRDAIFVMPYTNFSNECPPIHQRQGTIRLSYTGNIEGGRYKVIKMFLEAMDAERMDYHLDVYTRQGYYLGNYTNSHLTVHDPVPQTEVAQILNKSDGLLHVESFEKDDMRWTRYSLSTKIPEYLASGRPVFYLGPQKAGTGDFLSGGYADCAENSEELVKKIKDFFSHSNDQIVEIVRRRFIEAKKVLSEENMGQIFCGWYL